jgi:hypothetical protein
MKNALLKTFMIEAGDEADNEAAAQESAPPSHPQPAVPSGEAPAQTPVAAASGNGNLTRNQAGILHDMLLSKGYDDAWFLTRLQAKDVGDGALWSSIPGEHFTELRDVIIALPDRAAAAAATEPASGQEVAGSGASSAPEAPEPVATEAQQQAAQRAAQRPDGCTLDADYMQCAQIKRGEEPQCAGCEHFDAAWKPLDAATRTDQDAAAEGQPRKKGTVTEGMLRRLGELCASLEEEGVGRDEWRLMMHQKEGVYSRTELSKAAATRMIDYLVRWLTDAKSGVITTRGAA